MNIQEIIEKWTAENKPIGEMLGYPDCCISAFCNQPPQLMNGKPTEIDKLRYQSACINGKFTGFIPCENHAKLIIEGKISLNSLIDLGERDLFLPEFPNA